MANLILPNGQTIQTDNPAEIAEFMARGAQDQSAAVAASPGQTIQQIASERGQAWNSQGGQGYLDAMRGGFNDPTSDPRNPQAFSAAARQQYNNGLLAPTPPGGGGLLGGGGSGSGYGGGGGGGDGSYGNAAACPSSPTAGFTPDAKWRRRPSGL
jgi:hypothetical protein